MDSIFSVANGARDASSTCVFLIQAISRAPRKFEALKSELKSFASELLQYFPPAEEVDKKYAALAVSPPTDREKWRYSC
jgi:hypothetical protein